jgi:hypothetical protein
MDALLRSSVANPFAIDAMGSRSDAWPAGDVNDVLKPQGDVIVVTPVNGGVWLTRTAMLLHFNP